MTQAVYPSDASRPVSFSTQLSEFKVLPVVVNDMQTFGSRNGVSILDVAYHPVEADAKSRHGETQIDIRAKSDYRSVKGLISKLLAAHDGLALDALSFRRARSTDTLLDTEVRMTFYYKKGK